MRSVYAEALTNFFHRMAALAGGKILPLTCDALLQFNLKVETFVGIAQPLGQFSVNCTFNQCVQLFRGQI